jgi:hypothetical protein
VVIAGPAARIICVDAAYSAFFTGIAFTLAVVPVVTVAGAV